MTPPKKMALGRGLDALISTDLVKTQGSSSINEVPLNQIHANPDQPRRDFDQESLEELAEYERAHNIPALSPEQQKAIMTLTKQTGKKK